MNSNNSNNNDDIEDTKSISCTIEPILFAKNSLRSRGLDSYRPSEIQVIFPENMFPENTQHIKILMDIRMNFFFT